MCGIEGTRGMTPLWFDVAILAILVYTLIRGAAKGIVWQLAWIAALLLCFAVSETASPTLAEFIQVEAPLNRWIAMFAIYLASVFVTFWLARKIGDWIEKHRFVEFDKHLGAIFGVVKGVIFALTVTFFLVTLSTDARDLVMKSKSGYAAAIVMDRLHPVMPDDLHEVLEPYIHQLDDAEGNPDLHYSHDDPDSKKHSEEEGEKQTSLAKEVPTKKQPEAPVNSIKIQPGTHTTDRLKLLNYIASVHALDAASQSAIVLEIERAIVGLPDKIVLAVLKDWHADLSQGSIDPDPKTDAATSLDTRILRRLNAGGIPLDRLSFGLRTRLQDSERQ
jgi:uncharacterized membrane protein required for colicin V production